MSMRDYPINTTGFFIDAEAAAYIYLSLDRNDGSVPAEIQALLDDGTFAAKAKAGDFPCGYSDQSMIGDLLDDICFCSSYAGEVKTVFPEKTASPIEITDYENEYIALIEADRSPDLFKAAYESPEELLREFQEKLTDSGIEFPEDFDWWAHIVTVNGTYFC